MIGIDNLVAYVESSVAVQHEKAPTKPGGNERNNTPLFYPKWEGKAIWICSPGNASGGTPGFSAHSAGVVSGLRVLRLMGLRNQSLKPQRPRRPPQSPRRYFKLSF